MPERRLAVGGFYCVYKRGVDGKIAFLPQKEFVVFEGKDLIGSDVIKNPKQKRSSGLRMKAMEVFRTNKKKSFDLKKMSFLYCPGKRY